MSNKENGGPAFPVTRENFHSYDHRMTGGMTLRDYFAAKALSGVMTNAFEVDQLEDDILLSAAKQCYRMADAMLEARKQ